MTQLHSIKGSYAPNGQVFSTSAANASQPGRYRSRLRQPLTCGKIRVHMPFKCAQIDSRAAINALAESANSRGSLTTAGFGTDLYDLPALLPMYG